MLSHSISQILTDKIEHIRVSILKKILSTFLNIFYKSKNWWFILVIKFLKYYKIICRIQDKNILFSFFTQEKFNTLELVTSNFCNQDFFIFFIKFIIDNLFKSFNFSNISKFLVFHIFFLKQKYSIFCKR